MNMSQAFERGVEEKNYTLGRGKSKNVKALENIQNSRNESLAKLNLVEGL